MRVESELTTYISRRHTYTWFLEFCQLSDECWNIVDGRTLTLNVERRTLGCRAVLRTITVPSDRPQLQWARGSASARVRVLHDHVSVRACYPEQHPGLRSEFRVAHARVAEERRGRDSEEGSRKTRRCADAKQCVCGH